MAAALLLASAALGPAARAGGERANIVLDDGTLIAGDVVAADAEAVTIASPALGRIRLPRSAVVDIREAGPPAARRASAHDRLAPSNQASEPIEILQPHSQDPSARVLVGQALSLRVFEPLPASIAE